MLKEQFLKWSIVLLVCIISLPSANAQTPGYLGKKFSIGIGSSFYPAIFGPSKNQKSITDRRFSFNQPFLEKGFGMNSTFELSIDYAQFRYGSIGVYGSRYNTGMVARYRSFDTGFNEIDVFHILNTNTIGIRYSRFKANRGALAPIGRYVSYGLEGVFVSGQSKEIEFDGFPVVSEFLNFDQKKSFLNLSTKYMMSYPLSDNLLLKVGGSIRLPILLPSIYIRFFDSTGQFSLFEDSFKSFYDLSVINRIARHGFMRFELSLNYLLF